MKEQETTGEPGPNGTADTGSDRAPEPAAQDNASDARPVAPEPTPTPVDEPPPVVDPVQLELQTSKAKLRDTEVRLREVSKAYRDLEADMDAYRKRTQALADSRAERRGAEVVEQFFEPVRNLRRSVDATGSDPNTILEGLKMIAQQFDDTMRRLGLQEIPALGMPFDPTIHEALAVSPVTDAAQDGKVLFVHAVGYRLGGKVLQPAQVVIGKYGEPAPEA